MTTKEEEELKEQRRIKRMIRQGKFPRQVFAKGPLNQLERDPKTGYLTWRMIPVEKYLKGEK